MAKTKRARWAPGAVHAVPLADGSFGIAQVSGAMMLNVLYVALFGARASAIPTEIPTLERTAVVALVATWRQEVERGEWPRIGVGSVVVPRSEFPNEQFAHAGYVGARHYDADLLADFLSAYNGLAPWNVMHDEAYFDGLLALGVRRPSSVRILPPAERAAYRARAAAGNPPVT